MSDQIAATARIGRTSSAFRRYGTTVDQYLIDRKVVNVDLIPIALREDQTRLPSSLTDRFALQITSPS